MANRGCFISLVTDGPLCDFFTSASLGFVDMIQYHLDKGQDVDEQNDEGWTALMLATAFQQNEVVSNLLILGADVSKVDFSGKSFFSIAAANGNIRALNLIEEKWFSTKRQIKNGYIVSKSEIILATVNIKQLKDGFTPLMLASAQGFDDIIEKLIDFGADISSTNWKGQTAKDIAESSGLKSTSVLLHIYCNPSVDDLLKEIGLEKYIALFEHLTLQELLQFNGQDLKEIGLILLGPRKKLLMAIEKYRQLKMDSFSQSFNKGYM